jgi:general nucleoside transport system permease protein
MIDATSAFLEGVIRTATPLALAALGETVTERSGIINIGLEGSIIAGALGAVIGAAHGGVWGGFAFAAACGCGVAAIFALFAVTLRADQIISGTAVTLLALGGTGTLYRILYGSAGAALNTPTLDPTAIPLLSQIPVVGRALFVQPSITYFLYVLIPAVVWWMYRTHAGLGLRAIGENPAAAIAAGIRARRVQFLAVLFGGLLGGISGGTLVLAQAGTFVEGMSAGRGFIAIAIVVLGRWNPLGAALAALVFGAASALQFFFQATGSNLPYQLFLAFPYVLTLVALAATRGRTTSPAALGRQDFDQD